MSGNDNTREQSGTHDGRKDMKMTKLPIKARILEYLAINDRPVTARELFEAVKDEYPDEKTASEGKIEQTMLCYCRVEFMEPKEIQVVGDENLLAFQITETGRKELTYVPRYGNRLV